MELTLPVPVPVPNTFPIPLQLPKQIELPTWDKLKSIKSINLESIKSLIEIQTEPQVCLQIIPHFNVTNGLKIEKILDGIHSLDIPIHQRFKYQDNKLIYTTKQTFSYAILLESTNISFYYTIPQSIQDWFIQRVYSNWTNQVTIIPATIPYLSKFNNTNLIEWQLKPKYPTYKSLRDDYRDTPIPSILSCSKDLSDTTNDRILLEFTFSPIHDSFWKEKTLENQQKYRKGLLPDNIRTGIGWSFGDWVMKFFDGVFEFSNILFEVKPKKRSYYYSHSTNEMLESYNPKTNEVKYNMNKNRLESSSRQKINHNGFIGKLRILSQSEDKVKRDIFAKTMQVALRELHDDNEFVVSKKKVLNNEKDKHKNGKNNDDNNNNDGKNEIKPMKVNFLFDNFVYSSKEIGQLLQLPTKQWQTEYKIEKVDTQEINLPPVLLKGGIQQGTAKYKGQVQTVYWNNTDRDVACLPKCWFGIQGSGKTKALTRYGVESVENGRGLIVLDGIQECELSNEIRDHLPADFPEDKIIELNFSDLENVIPLSWNEININKLTKETDRLKFSNNLSQELIKFLDSMVEDNSQKLSPKMKRYLSNAGLLSFSVSNTTIMDVLMCLIEFDKRHELIDKSGLSQDNRIVQSLLELDDKNGDTKLNLVQGIIDRLDLLLGDYVLSNLFSTKGTNKIDFTKWITEGCAVFCKMPQSELNDATIKTLTTFLISKIWFAKLMLGKDIHHTVVICDEVHRTSLKFENIREMRKYGLEYIFSAHQPSDFKHILNTLKSAGCSFTLLTTTKDNVKHFESEIKPYTIDEVLDLKKYHGLSICNYDKAYIAFEITLPDIYGKDRFINRSYLSNKCAEKYGIKQG